MFVDWMLHRYNVMGHVKFCLTLLASLVVFGERLSLLQISGTVLAFSGTFLNTIIRLSS